IWLVAWRCCAASARRGRKLGSTYRSSTSAAALTCVSASHARRPFLMLASFVSEPLRADHQLEAMAVRILEVDTAVFPGAAGYDHSVLFQIGFERFVRTAPHVQREMVEVIARRQGRVPLLPEQRHALGARVQEDLPVVLSVDGHAQDLGVELLGARDIADVQHEMVDPGGLYHPSALPGNLRPYLAWIYAARGAKSTSNTRC